MGYRDVNPLMSPQYHALHDQHGADGNEVDPVYRYVLTPQDEADIDESTKVWTQEELKSTRGATGLLAVSDTEFVVEDANIRARNVTITESAGIGRYQNGMTIDL